MDPSQYFWQFLGTATRAYRPALVVTAALLVAAVAWPRPWPHEQRLPLRVRLSVLLLPLTPLAMLFLGSAFYGVKGDNGGSWSWHYPVLLGLGVLHLGLIGWVMYLHRRAAFVALLVAFAMMLWGGLAYLVGGMALADDWL